MEKECNSEIILKKQNLNIEEDKDIDKMINHFSKSIKDGNTEQAIDLYLSIKANKYALEIKNGKENSYFYITKKSV